MGKKFVYTFTVAIVQTKILEQIEVNDSMYGEQLLIKKAVENYCEENNLDPKTINYTLVKSKIIR